MVRYLTEVPVSLQGSVKKARSSPEVQAAIVQQATKYLEERLALHPIRIVVFTCTNFASFYFVCLECYAVIYYVLC